MGIYQAQWRPESCLENSGISISLSYKCEYSCWIIDDPLTLDCSAKPVMITITWSAMCRLASSGIGMHTTGPAAFVIAVCVNDPISNHESKRMWPTQSMNSFGLKKIYHSFVYKYILKIKTSPWPSRRAYVPIYDHLILCPLFQTEIEYQSLRELYDTSGIQCFHHKKYQWSMTNSRSVNEDYWIYNPCYG